MNRGTGGLLDTDRTLLADIYSSVDSVFEFGLGESSKIAAWVGVPRYVGVDSDASWVTNVRKEVNNDHFRFIFTDIGETGAYGNPKNEELQKIPLSYQDHVDFTRTDEDANAIVSCRRDAAWRFALFIFLPKTILHRSEE